MDINLKFPCDKVQVNINDFEREEKQLFPELARNNFRKRILDTPNNHCTT